MARGRTEPWREAGRADNAVQDGEPDEEDPDDERSTPHCSAPRKLPIESYAQTYRRLRATYTR